MKTATSLLLSVLLCGNCSGFGFFTPRHLTSSTYVQMQGLEEVYWTASTVLVGSFTGADDSNKAKTRVDGTCEYARIWVSVTSGAWSMKHFRPTGTNSFLWLEESAHTPSATGTNIVPVSWNLEEGDVFGHYLPNGTSAIKVSTGSGASGVDLRYTNVNITSGSFQLPGLNNNNAINMGLWGKGPALGFVGDSIQTGYPNYAPYLAPENTGGLASNSVPWKLKHEVGIFAHYQSFCVGGQSVQFAAATEMDAATNYGARVLVVEVGVNNMATNVWSDVEDDYLLIRSKHRGPVYFVSILPTSNLSDADSLERRQWNTNLFLLSKSNGAFFIDLQPEFGTNRVSTSMPDNLKPEYNLDNVHLTTLGTRKYAEMIKSAIQRHIK